MNAKTIIDTIRSATKRWTKQRKAEERDASRASRRREALIRERTVTVKDAAWQVMKPAYLHASNDGQNPAQARQVMYAARGKIQELTGRSLDDKYFTQTLLPDYLAEHPEETADWDVVFDARGHFAEPHTKVIVPLGTLDVRSYFGAMKSHRTGGVLLPTIKSTFPTSGPLHRFRAILFIEKEGFLPLFMAVRLAERFDIAIMSTKGMSVTAARMLIDQLCGQHDIPLLVLRDFDKSGFSIIGTLKRDNRRYEFKNAITVVDFGLRLEDVQEWGLQSEDVRYGQSDPGPNLKENGATPEEVAFLCRGKNADGYFGQRVELNAFTSGDFVKWIKKKLREQGIEKVMPDATTLELAYRRAVEIKLLNERMRRLASQIRERAMQTNLPADLHQKIATLLQANPAMPWDVAIAEIAATIRQE